MEFLVSFVALVALEELGDGLRGVGVAGRNVQVDHQQRGRLRALLDDLTDERVGGLVRQRPAKGHHERLNVLPVEGRDLVGRCGNESRIAGLVVELRIRLERGGDHPGEGQNENEAQDNQRPVAQRATQDAGFSY